MAHEVTSHTNISCIIEPHIGGNLAEKPPPPQGLGKNFDIGSIHFRQFRATLVFVAEKAPPPEDEGNFLTPDLSISGNFEQLWFLWQKSPPPTPG